MKNTPLRLFRFVHFAQIFFLCKFTIDILAEMWYNRRAAGCRQGPNPAPWPYMRNFCSCLTSVMRAPGIPKCLLICLTLIYVWSGPDPGPSICPAAPDILSYAPHLIIIHLIYLKIYDIILKKGQFSARIINSSLRGK